MDFGRALLRLLFISTSVVAFGVFVVIILRWVGAGISVSQSDFKEWGRLPVILARGDESVSPDFSRPSLEKIFTSKNLVPALELRVSRDLKWVVYGLQNLNVQTDLQGPVEIHDYDELKMAKWRDPRGGVGLVSLTELVTQYHPNKLLLIVHNKEVAAAQSLVELLGTRDENDQMGTLVFSPNHRLNRELRKLRPWWSFGADEAMIAQWHVFAAVGLEAFIPDDFGWLFSQELSPRLKSELRRRGIRYVISDEPKNRPVDGEIPLGIMTNRPNEILPRYPLQQDQ